MRLFSPIHRAGLRLAITFILAGANLLGLSVSAEDALPWQDKVAQTRIFPEPLVWTGQIAPPEEESAALYAIVKRLDEQMRNPAIIRTGITNGVAASTTVRRAPLDYSSLEGFIDAHRGSGWTPCLRANLGKLYREQGRYTPALEHWEKAWAATKSLTGPGKHVADFTLAHWASL